MNSPAHMITNGNQAAAYIAYKVNEVCAIYPITPSSEMSELVEEWNSEEKQNIFGSIPEVFEMQSEAGVAGAMHGAVQTGALATTFTASQGLLLMMPNMYKIAGELTPNVIHVATRSVATHALSVFGDHSDIMAVRSTGYAFLGASSVQEVHDFALIAQACTLESRIPFVHFFDGFRTSHEVAKIQLIDDTVIEDMINIQAVTRHREHALNPDAPVIRGTSQTSDVFFQSREAINPFYNACPDIVQEQMDKFAVLTKRRYRLFDYVGHPQAEHLIIAMASATEAIEEVVQILSDNGEKVGLIKVRLFRPFSSQHLIEALPKQCSSIAVLDRTKEPGASGEPLYLDIVQSISKAYKNRQISHFPFIIGGRYGLSSREFNPQMVKAIFHNLKQEYPKDNFTIGIHDDVTDLSLDFDEQQPIDSKHYQAIFYEKKSEATNKSFKHLITLFGDKNSHFVQGYSKCDYKKSEAISVTHFRIGTTEIKAPYLISEADFVACDFNIFIKNQDVLANIKQGGTLLINSALTPGCLWKALSDEYRKNIQDKEVQLYVVDATSIKNDFIENTYKVSGMHACFLILKKELKIGKAFSKIRKAILKVDTSILTESITVDKDDTFADTLLGKLIAGKSDQFPVSALPVDGTFFSDTSKYNSKIPGSRSGTQLPEWNPDACIQCGACSMACPQAALRIKAFENSFLENAPFGFQSIKAKELDLLNYTIQIHPDECTSCNHCVDVCEVKALKMVDKNEISNRKKEDWKYFKNIPELDRSKIDVNKISQQQLQEPLFKYSFGVDGCGEAPYLKLLSQLFGDRMLIANATGASSIFGGALPTTPWSKNEKGRGPAWSNSLFEDNAEFGLGFRLSLDQKENHAKGLLKKMMGYLDFDLVHDIISATQNTEAEINQQRNRVKVLKKALKDIEADETKILYELADHLVKKSIWMVGGDGWAYDIGYGGLDHIIASGKNVNILILDNEVYSNTGGQMSKATPFGASAKFAAKGKIKQKKDLGLIAMTYDDVYVASVAIGANQEQTLKAFIEAESYDGPSVIIAYCHSPSHGIDMKNPSQYHKAAVASGQWLLYRNDPRRLKKGLNSLLLDSDKPSIPIETYLKKEKRFSKFLTQNQSAFDKIIADMQEQINRRYLKYKKMSVLD